MSSDVIDATRNSVNYFLTRKGSKKLNVNTVTVETLRNYYLLFLFIKLKNRGCQVSTPLSQGEMSLTEIRETLGYGQRRE
jgi:hypothetical protein